MILRSRPSSHHMRHDDPQTRLLKVAPSVSTLNAAEGVFITTVLMTLFPHHNAVLDRLR